MQQEKIIKLIRNYIAGEIDTEKFCSEFENIFMDSDEDGSINSEQEDLLLGLYDNTIKRFSPYEEDIKLYQFYIDENSVKNDVIEFFNVNKDILL